MSNLKTPIPPSAQVSTSQIFDRSLKTTDIRGAQPQKLAQKNEIFENRSLITSDIKGAKPKISIRQLGKPNYDPSIRVQVKETSNSSRSPDILGKYISPNNSELIGFTPKSNIASYSLQGPPSSYQTIQQQNQVQQMLQATPQSNDSTQKSKKSYERMQGYDYEKSAFYNGPITDRIRKPHNQPQSQVLKESIFQNPQYLLKDSSSIRTPYSNSVTQSRLSLPGISQSRQQENSYQRSSLQLNQNNDYNKENSSRNASIFLNQSSIPNQSQVIQNISHNLGDQLMDQAIQTPSLNSYPQPQVKDHISSKHSLLEKNIFNQITKTANQATPYSLNSQIDQYRQSPTPIQSIVQSNLNPEQQQIIANKFNSFENSKLSNSKSQSKLPSIQWENKTNEYNLIGNFFQNKRTKNVDAFKGAGEHFLLNYNGDNIQNMRRDLRVNDTPYEVQFKHNKTKDRFNSIDAILSPVAPQQNKSLAFGHSDIFLGNYYSQRDPTDLSKFVYATKEPKFKSTSFAS